MAVRKPRLPHRAQTGAPQAVPAGIRVLSTTGAVERGSRSAGDVGVDHLHLDVLTEPVRAVRQHLGEMAPDPRYLGAHRHRPARVTEDVPGQLRRRASLAVQGQRVQQLGVAG